MAKQSVIKRQLKREILVEKYVAMRKALKQEMKTADSFAKKLVIHTKLQKLPRDSAKVRLKNRCWKTGRARSVFRDFGLCRHMVRQMGNEGLLPGVIKSSW
uniref:Small ribosomal subunit protein uS14c n=1 Tax=Eustigmatophyceae sp. Bat 8/9-7w TaxID=2506144 RepID=A0A3R5T8J7_9STRA|nr:ribosomal protein S14 [Eustigmatophyceae sp. Bat 8/9-7w]QAA11472.1 ribosomal protein S14 [Eustigmatophyceae sp. Bat 8/9-7w]